MPQEAIDRVWEQADEKLISAMNEVVLAGMAVLIIILWRWWGLLGIMLAFMAWQMLKKK